MKHVSTHFLRAVLGLLSLPVLALSLVGIPYLVVAGNVGYYLPIVLGLYVPAAMFFLALRQTLTLLRNIDANLAFSVSSVAALRHIKHYAVVVAGFYTLSLPYFFYAAERDDAPGVVAICLFLIFVAVVIAAFAAVLQKLLENGMALKSEVDLTV